MIKERKSRAFNSRYESPDQGFLPGFGHLFDRESEPSIHANQGEGNAIEVTFGQAKTAYDMNRIKNGLKITGESWIAGIIPELNLVKPAGAVALCLIVN